MSLKETLRLVVEADTKGAVQSIDNVGKAADKSLGKSKNNLDKLGSGLTKAGAGLIGFGAVALAGLGGLAKMSEEANLSAVKLQNTLDNMPKLAGENAKQFTDLATKLQSVTAADADAIVEGEALLGTFNLTAQQIKGITPLVVDYARKFGIDIPDAAVQVGKALDGQVGALKRNGVSIDEVAFKTDHYGAVQKALKDQVGGFAKAEGATFAGSLERMKNQLGDLAEGVGGGAVDAFTDLFGAVGKVAGALESISPGTQNTIGKVATFGAVALVAVGGVSTLIGKLIEIRRTFGQVASGASSLINKFGGLGAAAGAAGAVAAVAGLALELKHFDDAAHAAEADKLTKALDSVSEAGRKTAERMIFVEYHMGVLDRNFKKVLESSVPAAREFVKIAEAAGVGKDKIREFNKAIEEKKAQDVGASKSQSAYTDEVQKGAEALDSETDSTTAATDALKNYEDELHALIDPLFGLQDALQGNIDAQSEVSAKFLESEAAQAAYNKAVKAHGPNSKAARDASLELAEAQHALDDANRSAVRSAEDVDFAIQELRAEIQQNPKALDQAKAKLREWQRQGLITAAQAKATAAQFDGLSRSIRKTPSRKNIAVGTAGINRARVELQKVKDSVDRIPGFKQVEIHFAATGEAAVSIAKAKLLGFASGGRVPGPLGAPRVILAHGGEEIVPLHDKAALARYKPSMAGAPVGHSGLAGASRISVDINVAGDGLMRYLRNQVRVQYGGDVQAALGGKR